MPPEASASDPELDALLGQGGLAGGNGSGVAPVNPDAGEETRHALEDWAHKALAVHRYRGDILRLEIATKAEALRGIVAYPLDTCDATVRHVATALGVADPFLEQMTDESGETAREVAEDGVFIDWSTFWQRDHAEAEWVFPEVLARSRGHSIYASHKAGKSLIMLYIAAKLATGPEPVAVTYFDYEMTAEDIFDRLEDMGYGPDTDLSRLKYALLPALPPLDTTEGALALTQLLDGVQAEHQDHHLVTIFDTMSRAVHGEENDADTIRDFYNHTGIALKRRGITWARLDHAGKDRAKGQRGSSAKGDDVDLVWRLSATESGIALKRELSRMSWVPEHVTFGVFDNPLRYVRLTNDWPEGTSEVANLLDGYELPTNVSTREATRVLREHEESRRRAVIVAAIRWRKERAEYEV